MAKKKRKKLIEESKKVKTSDSSFFDDILESKYYFGYYAIFIAFLTTILFNNFIFSNKMLFGSDSLQAGVFFRNYFVEYFKAHGSVPLWDPYIFGGMPFVDAFHGDIFYPISFVFKMIFPLFRALGWILIFHIFLAGITMYLCARTFNLNKLASSFAGLFYMFAPYLVSLVAPGHDGKMFVTALFPLTIMFLERGMERKSYLDFVGLGTVIGLIILTPHPQMAYFCLWAIGSYFLYKLIARYLKERSIQIASLLTGSFILAIIIGLALSAIQFYPGYKYVKEFSPRSGEGRGGYEWATSWSLHTEELVGMFVPNFAGVNSFNENTYWGKNPFKDNSEYIGIFPILFGILALVFYHDKRKWFFLGAGTVTLIYALGATTPFFYIFYHLIPNVKSMRAPSMIMFLFSFSFALLGAMGIQYIIETSRSEKPNRKKKLLNIVLISTIIYAAFAMLWSLLGGSLMNLYQSIFYSGIQPEKIQASASNVGNIQVGLWLSAILIGLVFVILKNFSLRKVGIIAVAAIALITLADVWRLDFKFIEILDPTTRFAPHSSVTFLKKQIGHDRLIDLTGGIFGSRDYYAYHDLAQVAGYHGNQLKIYDRLIGKLACENLYSRNGRVKLPVLNLLGVKYIAYNSRYPVTDTNLTKVFDQNYVSIYINRQALPRAFIVHDYRVISDPDSTVQIVADPRFNPRQFVLLEEKPNFQPVQPAVSPDEECDITEYEPEHVRITVRLQEPAFVCLSDSYYPAWKAYIDGKPAETYVAYSALRAVGVPAGEHTIKYVYKSKIYERSKSVTYITILFIALSFIVGIVYPRITQGKKDG